MLQQWRRPMELIRHGQVVLVKGHSMDSFVVRRSIGVAAAAVVVVSVGVETSRSLTLFYSDGLNGWEHDTPTRCLVVPMFWQERHRVLSNLCCPPFLRLQSMKLLCHVNVRERVTEQLSESLERERETEDERASVNTSLSSSSPVRSFRQYPTKVRWIQPCSCSFCWTDYFSIVRASFDAFLLSSLCSVTKIRSYSANWSVSIVW